VADDKTFLIRKRANYNDLLINEVVWERVNGNKFF
jgi:hypothetical protein